MTDENRPSGVLGRLQTRLDRHMAPSEGPHLLRRMDAADYTSLGALFLAWVSTTLFLTGEPNWGIVTMFGAFLFDKLDGFMARRYGMDSDLGLQVDSYIDIFTYLVTAALLYHFELSPNAVVSAVVGFVIICFGGLRLIRHSDEGFGKDDGTSYYRGITVVHVNVVVVMSYFLVQLTPFWNGWLTGLAVAIISPVMISDYKSYKTDYGHFAVGVLAVAASGLALALQFGWL